MRDGGAVVVVADDDVVEDVDYADRALPRSAVVAAALRTVAALLHRSAGEAAVAAHSDLHSTAAEDADTCADTEEDTFRIPEEVPYNIRRIPVEAVDTESLRIRGEEEAGIPEGAVLRVDRQGVAVEERIPEEGRIHAVGNSYADTGDREEEPALEYSAVEVAQEEALIHPLA